MRSALGHPAAEIIADAAKLHQTYPNDARLELLLGYAHALADDRAEAAKCFKSVAGRPGLPDDLARVLIA